MKGLLSSFVLLLKTQIQIKPFGVSMATPFHFFTFSFCRQNDGKVMSSMALMMRGLVF
jgi:hypothetical protein